MGCNYYLKYKGLNLKQHNDYTDITEKVTELDNGYVYKEHYFTEYPEDLLDLIHIGKSSLGWHFMLCIYPELKINNLNDWKELFDKYEIIDECGKTVSKEDMLETITKRESIGNPLTEDEIKEFCKENHAEVGLNGLFAHKTTAPFIFTRTEGTYDLTESWDFC